MTVVLAAAGGVAALVAAPLIAVAAVGGTTSGDGCGPSAASVGRPVAGVSAAQADVARTTVGVVKRRGLPRRAAVLVLAAERQESDLTNLDHGPDGSLGVLQQRPSWGTAAQRMSVPWAVGAFLDRLTGVDGWTTRPLADVVQAVQISADGTLYTRSEAIAERLTGIYWPLPGCPSPGGPAGAPGTPPSQQARVALARAAVMLGRPYCWVGGDAAGPTHGTGGAGCAAGTVGFDCSGLTLYAWAPYVQLGHYTGDQAAAGRRVPLSRAAPGDLVFLATGPVPHHVAMVWAVNGDGTGQIIEAQDFGVPVHIRSFAGSREPEIMPYAVRLAG